MKYPNSETLKKHSDFQIVYREGKSCANRYLVLYVKENGLKKNRLGISVSKKVGNSVKRSVDLRRRRDSVSLTEMEIPTGYDFIIIARNTITNAKCADVKKSFESALRRTGVVKK